MKYFTILIKHLTTNLNAYTVLENMSLKEIFSQSMTNNKITLEYTKYLDILKKDVKVDIQKLDYVTLKVLSKVMIHYMRHWSCWAEIRTNPKDFYSGLALMRFRKYLKKSMLFVLKNKEELWKMSKHLDVNAVQHPDGTTDSTLPYWIEIRGTANYINSLYFIKEKNGIAIKQHPIAEWDVEKITFENFINYPYVCVNLTLPDISLSRNNNMEVERYLRLDIDQADLPIGEFIRYTRKLDSSAPVAVYTLSFFEKYVEQFESIVSESNMITEFRKLEVLTILYAFLEDIDECDLYGKTMSTNAAVCFNIGKCRYVRNKKAKLNSSVSNKKNVYFYEHLTPRVLLSLKHFNAEQDVSPTGLAADEVTFVQLNPPYSIKDLAAAISKDDCVSYSCTLCNEAFSTYEDIRAHFQSHHKGDSDVTCPKCYKKFALLELAECRWDHSCV